MILYTISLRYYLIEILPIFSTKSIFLLSSVDIDECQAETGNCTTNAECKNTIGKYMCECKTGFEGDGNKFCFGMW